MNEKTSPLPPRVYEERTRGTYIDEHGREICDPTPVAPPVGYNRLPSIFEQIQRFMRSEHMKLKAQDAGVETFEEADDFEVGDDYDPHSPYENEGDISVAELINAGRLALAEKAEKDKPKPPFGDGIPDLPPPPEPAPKSK